MERITIRLYDDADIRWWQRFCRGKTKNAAGVEMVHIARGGHEQLDRIERKLDDLLARRVIVEETGVDQVETELDEQLSEWL